MNPLENNAKFVPLTKQPKFWLIACGLAALFFFGGMKICQLKAPLGCDFSKELNIVYPKDFNTICALPQFEAALQQYAKHCDVGGTEQQRMQSVWYDGNPVANSCCNNPKPDTGSHVTQCVAFATLQDLENFLNATK